MQPHEACRSCCCLIGPSRPLGQAVGHRRTGCWSSRSGSWSALAPPAQREVPRGAAVPPAPEPADMRYPQTHRQHGTSTPTVAKLGVLAARRCLHWYPAAAWVRSKCHLFAAGTAPRSTTTATPIAAVAPHYRTAAAPIAAVARHHSITAATPIAAAARTAIQQQRRRRDGCHNRYLNRCRRRRDPRPRRHWSSCLHVPSAQR